MTAPDDAPPPENRPFSGRLVSGRFAGGFSGNPGGRPRRERECAAILDELTPAVLRMLGRKALTEGDVAAGRIIVQAGLPPARAAIAQLDLGPMQTAKGCQLAIARISEAVATGLLAPPDAAPFLALVAAASKQIEIGEIADRIARIERILAGKEGPQTFAEPDHE